VHSDAGDGLGVLTRVVAAEQQLTVLEDGAHERLGTAAVAAVSSGQGGGGGGGSGSSGHT